LTAIADLPMDIRGYGPINDKALKIARKRLAGPLAESRLPVHADWPVPSGPTRRARII
jgi:hypothetical protein